MCGICGFNWEDKKLLLEMIKTLNHRGPDNKGHYIDNLISLGHTRLSIIDLSERGKQPIHNEDGSIIIIFNGEIYNYKSLSLDLKKKGHTFYTETDTEVIIHSYEEYGYNCLKKLNGQFSFCIYDKIKNVLFLARDRFGIKPLYYYLENNNFIFGSEIKSILLHEFEKSVNKLALQNYFVFRYSIAPNTLFNHIYKLKPSHYLIFDLKSKKISFNRYFKIDLYHMDDITHNISNIRDNVFKLILDSVKLRMIADVPVGCFLSGGIDSSIITGIASKINPDINTFSVGFETSDELKYAEIVSEFFNTNHHELLITNEDILSNIDKMIYHMDEPIGDPGFFPTLLISKLASKHNKVVLAGEGADEIFGGYDKYKMYFYGKYLSYCIPKLNYSNEILNRISKFSNQTESEGYQETIRVFNIQELNKLNLKPVRLNNHWLNSNDIFKKMQYFDLNTLMPEDFFMKADKMSSAYGLEERVPYMDHRLVEFALNLPIKLKLHFWNEKYLLKKTFSSFLPKVIINRRKRGYNVPIDHWFKTILDSKILEVMEENNHKLYDKDYVFDLLKKIKRKGNIYKENFYLAQKLWTIFIFEEWYNKFILN